MYGFNSIGISTICIAICSILNLYGVIMCNEQGIRLFGMLGSFFYILLLFTRNLKDINQYWFNLLNIL